MALVASAGSTGAFWQRLSWLEDLEVDLLVELRQVEFGGRAEQLAGQGGEHAVVAGGVIAQRVLSVAVN